LLFVTCPQLQCPVSMQLWISKANNLRHIDINVSKSLAARWITCRCSTIYQYEATLLL
jgi:hypothetical protein